MTSHTLSKGRRSARLNRTVSAIALASGMLGVAGLASPAAAQCVENPATVWTCSGQTNQSQVIVSPGATVTTTAGFGVDTSGNGNGVALAITGPGLISYTDENESDLIGGGVGMVTTGEIFFYSTGDIIADANTGLDLFNFGGSNITAFSGGTITNTNGHGVHSQNIGTTGDLLLVLNAVNASGMGVLAQYDGAGLIELNLNGPITAGGFAGVWVDVANGGDVTVQATDVTGQGYGIVVENEGTGFTRVTSTGVVTAQAIDGVAILAGPSTTGVEVSVNEVNASLNGVVVQNFGSGETTITATGRIVAGGAGVFGFTGSLDGGLTINTSEVISSTGVVAQNAGTGVTRITSTGDVTGIDQEGIRVENGASATGVFVEATNVTARQGGISIDNLGSGETRVEASGGVTSELANGIRINADVLAGDVVVAAVDVSGGLNGILIENFGVGETFVITTGAVTGVESGIDIATGTGTTDLTVLANAVEGGVHGIRTNNEGSGETFIRTAGTVTGGDYGILARNGVGATDVTVQTIDVQALGDAIRVDNLGTGNTNILSLGSILAVNGAGVSVTNAPGSGDIEIDVNNVSAGETGVSAVNAGNGAITVTLRGLVEGGFAGVDLGSSSGEPVGVFNEGVLRNSSTASSDLALRAFGENVGVVNFGQIHGTISFAAVTESLVLNLGIWDSTGGESFFSGDADSVLNLETGLMIARSGAGTNDVTSLLGLEVLENHGGITLRDGGATDLLQTSANTTFFEGSTLFVDIGGAGLADRFLTTGTLDIQEGSLISLNTVAPLVLYSQYLVAEASGGITGEFDFDDVFLTAFAGLRDTYTATEAFIEFAQLRPLADAGVTPNQKEAAAGADSLPDGSPVKDALLMLADDAAAVDAFDQLSGEVHPTARTALVEDSRLPRDAALARLSDGEPQGAVWARAWVDDTASFGDFNAARAEGDVRGLVAGVDRPVGDNLTLGVAVAWSDTDLEIERRDSLAEVKTVQGLVYAGGRFGPWGVRGGVGYAKSSVETGRTVAFPGFAATLDADYDATVLQGFIEAGYRMPAAGGHVEPFANLTALRIETDGFVETGGAAALTGEASEDDVLMSTLGVRFETNRMGAFSLRGVAGWRHAWGDLEPAGVHAFDGGDPFTILGAVHSEDAAVANVEAQWQVGRNTSFGVAVDTVFGSDNSAQGITAGFKVVF